MKYIKRELKVENMAFYNVCGYAGSAFMVGFSFCLLPTVALIGFALLTIQAVKIKAWNLVALNIVSSCGMFYQLFLK